MWAMPRVELDESAEEVSAFETWSGSESNEEGELRPAVYNPDIPIEHFDCSTDRLCCCGASGVKPVP